MHEDGYVRTFYKAIKDGTADGVIARTFITGVSPIMLDDVTSGANIFTISSNDKDLNAMLGITEEEVNTILDYYKLDNIIKKEKLLNIFKGYCNGYKFNEKITDTVYNTDMVLYIIKNIVQKQEYPEKLIDENVKTDYGRLRNIAENFVTKEDMLNMLEEGEVGPVEIKDRFNLESLYKGDDKTANVRSLLYYLGMFTIGKTYGNKVMLKVPNYTVKSLYWEYMSRVYEIDKAARYEDLAKAMETMRMECSIEDIMTIYTSVINRLSSRDLSYFNEASCKSIFITLAYTDGIYLIASEREASGGYSDLYLKENVIYKEYVKYRYMIEFKHIKVSELKGDINKLSYEELKKLNKDIIKQKQKEAKNQLENYMKEHNVIGDRILKKFTVVVLGRKYVEYETIDN
ncbi:MAG: AAA family ATPase [Bacillota bacterium]|nr:AAA family ATPase [Bacillota bacterium]